MEVGGYQLDLVERIAPSLGATFVGKRDILLVARGKRGAKYELELFQLPGFKSLRRGKVKSIATITRVGEQHVLLMLPKDLDAASVNGWEREFEVRSVDDFGVAANFLEAMPGHVAAHPDGSLIAVAHDFGALNVRDARTGELISAYASKGVGGVAYSPDGRLLAAKEFEGALKFFDAEEPGKKPLRSVRLGRGTAVAFHPQKPLVAAADKQAIRIVDADTAKVRSSIKVTKRESQGTIRQMAFSPDGCLLVTATRSDNVVGLWNVEQDEFLGHVKEFDSALSHVEFDEQGKYLLIATFK
ncbi:MAG: hypothetical protein QOC61_1689, partial [Acidobacteriota bacterium]|nr:hypothetical protein [Acidobacteriota bacterium]